MALCGHPGRLLGRWCEAVLKSEGETLGYPGPPGGVLPDVVQLGDLAGGVAQEISHLAW